LQIGRNLSIRRKFSVVFGLGRGVPFLLAGLAGSAITGLIQLGSWSRVIQLASAAALLIVSAYYANIFVELL